MKNLVLFCFLFFAIYSKGFCQEINSYQEYILYKEKNTKKIKELQEKENQTETDRYKIVGYFEESSKILENLLQTKNENQSEIITDLIDNYTYCMRKYPDKKDTSMILGYFAKAKNIGLCDYTYCNFVFELRGDDVFQLVKHDTCIQKVLQRFEREEALWKNNHFKTEFKENITAKEKIAGLSKLWSEAKFNFAYFDKVPSLNWDSLFISFIPKVLSTHSTKAYYDTLKTLCAKLEDSHTEVFYPKKLNIGRPPVRCKIIEDRVFISEVLNDSLGQIGLKTGMELDKINNISVNEYANKFIKPYISSSTKQDLLVRTYEYYLFEGDRNKLINIEVKDSIGRKHNYQISRTLPYNIPFRNSKSIEFKVLDNNIGYLTLNTFSGNRNIKEDFNNVFDEIQHTDGLIIDIRNNGGGNSENGNYIFSCFIIKPALIWNREALNYSPPERAQGKFPSWHKYSDGFVKPNHQRYYSKPIVLLTGAKTFSAAEDFCILFDINQRAKIIGQPTGGSTGQPLYFDLPGGGKARICTLKCYYPDGKEFVGYGIQPHIYVEQTISDFQEGKDAVLEKAIEYFNDIKK